MPEGSYIPALLVFGSWILPSLLLAVVLPVMAGGRGLSRLPWFFIGIVPVVNMIGLILLALKPRADGVPPAR